jgi:DNA (cytosine-5)-methyltransferase 1
LNNNKKLNLKIIELCSGIGAQVKGIKNTDLFNTEVVATADLDKEVVVSYAAIHCGLTNELINNYEDYPSKEEMIKELTDKRLGYDFKNDKPYDWEKLAKKKDKTKGIEKYWLADKLSHNLGDMKMIKEIPDCDFMSYSTPCQSLSVSGKQEGLKWTCQDCGYEYDPATLDVESRYTCPSCGSHNIKNTRSGLLYEVERLLVKAKENDNLPKYLLMENVDALVSKKFIDSFKDWIERLDSLGFNSYYQVINAKDTGIPQSRNRIFVISIRKDIDTGKFEFPKPFDTGIRLKDMLEDDEEVLDKYFLSDEVQRRLQITDEKFEKNIIGTTKPDFRTIGKRDLVYKKDSVIGALVSTDYKQPKQILENPNEINKIGKLDCEGWGNVDTDVVADDGISPTLQTHNRHNIVSANEPIHIADLNSEKYQRMHEISRRIYSEDGIAPTMHTCSGGNTEPKIEKDNLRIVRKLTPKEAHRLMGFDDIDYENCKAVGMSDTQGYKQAGNSIVTNCISLLIEHLYKAQYDNTYICTDEKMVNFQIPQAE